MLHWHGDNLELPVGAARLASTAICPNQGFSKGPRCLGLQFHPEVDGRGFERWLIGHAGEIAGAGLSPVDLRKTCQTHAAAAAARGRQMLNDWIDAWF